MIEVGSKLQRMEGRPMWDAIVVGARCAGSPLAMLLARKGHKVLAVDRSTFPSDVPHSTHLLHMRGCAYLQQWGLLDKLRATGCPPLKSYLVDFGPVQFKAQLQPFEGVTEAFAPRRIKLDQVLVDAAREAGVTLNEGFTVDEVLMENGTVVGIRGRDASGKETVERAKVVIGADGMNSVVAKATKPKLYKERESKVMTYFGYFRNLKLAVDVELHPRPPGRCAYAWPTHDGLTLVGANWFTHEFDEIKKDPERHFPEVVRQCAPAIADGLKGAQREGDLIGGFTQNFYRHPYGPGWALVGDAGSNYEFCSGQGITNGFRTAALLADALDEGLRAPDAMNASLRRFHEARDREELPYYDFTYKNMTLLKPPPGFMKIFAAIAANHNDVQKFLGVVAETVPPGEFFAPLNMLRLAGKAFFGSTAPAAAP
jgi:2-polyprenyl-6-methoxyphenol hydroxylase-like FAD-dependent oxidoreductase